MGHPTISITALFSRNTALRLAAQAGAEDVVRTLLRGGADVNAGALRGAAQRADPSMALELICLGANVNQEDQHGCRPLHYAAYGVCPETAAALLEKGAEPNARGAKGWTALHMASLGNEKTLREMLPRISAPRSSLSTAIPEHRATDPRFASLAKILLTHGADVQASTDAGDTPLQFACHWGFRDLAEMLTDHGADVNAKNELGEFPLLWSSLLGEIRLSRFLVEHGANVDASTKRGATALHLAALHGHYDLVVFLAEKGANLSAVAQGPQGQVTSLDMARAAGHGRIVVFLESLRTPNADISNSPSVTRE